MAGGGEMERPRRSNPIESLFEFILFNSRWLLAPLYLGLIAVLPVFAFALLGVSGKFIFGGTSLLIMVGVGLDTVKQIESQLQQRHYEGFLR